jgi:hypothetical protein
LSHERVVRRNSVLTIPRGARVHIDANHFAENLVQVLPVAAG